eukprot:11200614-Lingulodinium_polyedra.AAC.1
MKSRCVASQSLSLAKHDSDSANLLAQWSAGQSSDSGAAELESALSEKLKEKVEGDGLAGGQEDDLEPPA